MTATAPAEGGDVALEAVTEDDSAGLAEVAAGDWPAAGRGLRRPRGLTVRG